VIAGELAQGEGAPSGSGPRTNAVALHTPAHVPAHASAHPPAGGEASDRTPTWHPEVLNGPFSTRALLRLDEALRLADAATGLTFSIYVGPLDEPVRDNALALHAELADPDRSVLIAVSPNQRQLEIITGAVARQRLLDRDCKLAALSMAAAFTGGDLGGGIVSGLAQLAGHAGKA
jgi:Domain of unknown function (DUF5130)